MVVSSSSSSEESSLEEVVVYRKEAGSSDPSNFNNTDLSNARGGWGFERPCCCGCSVSCCLTFWGIVVILCGIGSFFGAINAFVWFKSFQKWLLMLLAIFTGAVVLTTGILTLIGTCRRHQRTLRIAFYLIIATMIYLSAKNVALYFLLGGLGDSRDYQYYACYCDASGPFFSYIFLLVLICRATR